MTWIDLLNPPVLLGFIVWVMIEGALIAALLFIVGAPLVWAVSGICRLVAEIRADAKKGRP